MRKSKTPTPVITAILTLITIFFWAGFEIFRSFTSKEPPQIEEEIINPLDPTLDSKILDEVANRPFLTDTEIGNTITISPSPSNTTPPLPSASSSATPVLSPSPTTTPTSSP